MTEHKTNRKINITELKNWVLEMKILIIAAAAVVIAIVDAFWCGTERSFSLAGFWLQFSGMVLAINGVWDIPKQLNVQTPIDIFTEWWGKRPWKQKVVYGAAQLKGRASLTAKGSCGGWEEYNPGHTDEINIRNAFQNLNMLRSGQDNHEKAMSMLKDDAARDRKKVDEDIKKLTEKTHKDRVKFHTSSFGWSLVGLFWVLTGMILAILGPLFVQ